MLFIIRFLFCRKNPAGRNEKKKRGRRGTFPEEESTQTVVDGGGSE